jgi:two-component system, sensor histidine kinase PdtaS
LRLGLDACPFIGRKPSKAPIVTATTSELGARGNAVAGNYPSNARWPLWGQIATTCAVLAVAYLFQHPLERSVPGEPFLLFLLVVISATLAFGSTAGFVAMGLSTFLSIYFFDPVDSLVLKHASDLIGIEVYAVVSGTSVVAFGRLGNALVAAGDKADSLERSDQSKSLLLRELVHGVANNFATVTALMSLKSASVADTKAKLALVEAIEQVNVMARVHRRLRAYDQLASLDSRAFIHELCDDLEGMVGGRPLQIERDADSCSLCMHQAVSLGLVLNELVTNAVKHAFPNGRAGRISVRFEAHNDGFRLLVEDDGVGFGCSAPSGVNSGQGEELVRGLAHELGGDFRIVSSSQGSSCCLSIPRAGSQTPVLAAQSGAQLIH